MILLANFKGWIQTSRLPFLASKREPSFREPLRDSGPGVQSGPTRISSKFELRIETSNSNLIRFDLQPGILRHRCNGVESSEAGMDHFLVIKKCLITEFFGYLHCRFYSHCNTVLDI